MDKGAYEIAPFVPDPSSEIMPAKSQTAKSQTTKLSQKTRPVFAVSVQQISERARQRVKKTAADTLKTRADKARAKEN